MERKVWRPGGAGWRLDACEVEEPERPLCVKTSCNGRSMPAGRFRCAEVDAVYINPHWLTAS